MLFEHLITLAVPCVDERQFDGLLHQVRSLDRHGFKFLANEKPLDLRQGAVLFGSPPQAGGEVGVIQLT